MRQTVLLIIAAWLGLGSRQACAGADAGARVTLRQDASAFILDNGPVVARLDQRSGSFSLSFNGIPVVKRGYWSQVGRSSVGAIGRLGSRVSWKVRTDPASNDGERAEVSCRFEYAGGSGRLPCAVEIRYALGRGDRGLYAYAIWTHRPGSPGFSVAEGRIALKLDPQVFDYLAIDANRHGLMPTGYDWDHGTPLNLKEARRMTTGRFVGRVEHKYDYSAILADTPAYGWCGTTRRVGVWMINPSIEYLAGGPTKVELTGHLDANPGGVPVLLDMWHSSHYGGSSLVVAQEEPWAKCIGPILIYCNAGESPRKMWDDALAQAKAQHDAWPYAWVNDPEYPPKSRRGGATGTIRVSDPLEANLDARNTWVGLAAPAYEPPGSPAGASPVDWQRDSKHYQFWTRADSRGNFTLPNVRPGSYVLYAFADGVLGQFTGPDVTIPSGKTISLGTLTWKPLRYGRTLWEIGIPDRSAAEFRHGDHYWQWGLYYEYPREFPHDVDFTIGQSEWRRDWNYCQPPRIEGRQVKPTTWTIHFNLPEAPRGHAALRLAICGSRGRGGIDVAVNGSPAGNTGPIPDSGVMHRDGIRGYWCERDVSFDASLLKRGANTLTLTNPARRWVDGVLYDYLRLEAN